MYSVLYWIILRKYALCTVCNVGIATVTTVKNTVSIGDSVSFRCQSDDPAALVFLTTPLIGRIIADETTPANVLYTLPNVTAADNGLVISCKDGTSNQQADFIVDVLSKNDVRIYKCFPLCLLYSVPPQVIFPMTSYGAKEGTPLNITGNVTGNRMPTSVWRREGTIIEDNSQRDVSSNSIVFSSVQRGDNGTYTINSINSEGSDTFTFSLEVYCELHKVKIIPD